MTDFVGGLHPILQALFRVSLFFTPVFIILPVMIWWERRLLAFFQDRQGPNRVGNYHFSETNEKVPAFLRGRTFTLWGLPQVLCDGIKGFFKEDLAPNGVDRLLYFLAPAVFMFPAFLLGGTIPMGPFPALTPIANVDIGVLYILAVSSLAVYGVVLAGYSSNNKYSLLGGLRSSAQLISYELGLGISLAAVVMAVGSLRPTDIVADQAKPLYGFIPFLANWTVLTPYGFVAFVIFFICVTAETNRAPFDLPEAESELVSGYNTEYSTKKWVLFMMAEYVGLITYSAIIATVFLGGYNLLPIPWGWAAEQLPNNGFLRALDFLNGNSWLGPIYLWGKVCVLLTCFIWIRATLPRLRYDQLMNLGWKSLLPIAVGNLMVVATWIFVSRLYGPGWALLTVVAAFGLIWALHRSFRQSFADQKSALETRTIRLVHDEPRPPVELLDAVPAPAEEAAPVA